MVIWQLILVFTILDPWRQNKSKLISDGEYIHVIFYLRHIGKILFIKDIFLNSESNTPLFEMRIT